MASTFENTMSAGFAALIAAAPKEIARAVYEFAEGEVLPVAKERTPVDYGTLRDSGVVSQPKIKGVNQHVDNISVEIGFGGAAAHYAIYVHEDLDAKHEVGQAKFLSSAMDEASGKFVEVVSANVARALGM